MSLTALPPPPRKVRLWHIFFALPAMNGPLPAEQKFRENTADIMIYSQCGRKAIRRCCHSTESIACRKSRVYICNQTSYRI